MTTRPARSDEPAATRPATCRQDGCAEAAITREGFCEACKGAYEHARTAREAELAHTTRLLAQANPEWAVVFADARAGEYERMLEHAAAHHLQYGGLPQDAMSLLALHDYLEDSMDRIRREHR
jgi:hypothetical protein